MLRPGSPYERLITEAVIAQAEQQQDDRDIALADRTAAETTKGLIALLQTLGFPISLSDSA